MLQLAEKRAKAFGSRVSAFGIGFVLGPAIGGILAEHGSTPLRGADDERGHTNMAAAAAAAAMAPGRRRHHQLLVLGAALHVAGGCLLLTDGRGAGTGLVAEQLARHCAGPHCRTPGRLDRRRGGRCWPQRRSSPGSRAAASTGPGHWVTGRCSPTRATRQHPTDERRQGPGAVPAHRPDGPRRPRRRRSSRGVHPSPYMLFVHQVQPEWRERIPAVTHVDGTARVQTVDPRTRTAGGGAAGPSSSGSPGCRWW